MQGVSDDRGESGAGARRARIGHQAAERVQILATIAADLCDAAGRSFAPAVRAARRGAGSRVTRIAFVGLSGAATRPLIGVLAGHPGLLPLDRSGHSLAVVRALFGDPGGRQSGAVFSFFDEEAWSALEEGAGRLRGGPGSDPQSVRAQIRREVQAVRDTASERLGARMQGLMGARHSVDRAVPELLARYLEGGRADDPILRSERTPYAALTRMAEIFLPGGRFACPVELVDTPGAVADRLLPEEITLRAIEEADAVIAVADATAPVSGLDEAVLRRLIGHGGRALTLVLDRIDAAGDPRTALAEREAMIRRVMPGLDVPVVPVSVALAERAVLLVESPGRPETRAEIARLSVQSGLGALERRVGEILFWGPARSALEAAVRRVEAEARRAAEVLTEGAAAARRARSPVPEAGAPGASATPDGPDAADRAAVDRLAEAEIAARGRLAAEVDRAWGRIHTPVMRVLATGARAEAEAMHEAIDHSDAAIGQVDLGPLADRIAATLTAELAAQGQALAAEIETAREAFAAILTEFGPSASLPAPETRALTEALTEAAPRGAPGPRAITLDITRRQLLLRGYFRREDRLEILAERVTAALLPALNEAIESATLALGNAARDTLAGLAADAARRLSDTPAAIAPGEGRAAELEMRAEACREIAEQLARFRVAIADPSPPFEMRAEAS